MVIRTVILSSKDLNIKYNSSQTTSNFTITGLNIQNPLTFKILFLQIPISYYNVQDNLQVVINGTTYNSSNLLTPGWYTATQLATLLTSLDLFTFDYNSSNGKFNITGSVFGSVQISNWSNDMLIMIGYPPNTNNFTNTDLTGSSSYISPNVANLSPNSVIRISSSALSGQISNKQIWSDSSATLIESFITSPFSSMQTEEFENPTEYILSNNSDINNIDIQINDINNNNINLNGVNCCVKLEFLCK